MAGDTARPVIWHSDSHWTLTADLPLKCDRSLRNLVRWCKMGLLTATAVKKIRISKIKDGGRPPFLKPLNRRLTDFDEIWHNDVHGLLTADRPLKFRIFENPTWRQPPSWNHKKCDISKIRVVYSLGSPMLKPWHLTFWPWTVVIHGGSRAHPCHQV